MSPWTVGRAHSNLSRRLTWTAVYQIVSRSFHCLVWKEWMRQNLYQKGPFLCKIDQFWSLCISKLNTTSIHSEGLWVRECLVRPCFHLKVLLRWLNSKGFSKVVFFMCCCKLLEIVQTWLHWSHVNGFSHVCFRIMCCFNSLVVILTRCASVWLFTRVSLLVNDQVAWFNYCLPSTQYLCADWQKSC